MPTTWLSNQKALRDYAFEQQLALDARRRALRCQREEELAAEAVKVRARQCPDCYEVRTPANTCRCTDG